MAALVLVFCAVGFFLVGTDAYTMEALDYRVTPITNQWRNVSSSGLPFLARHSLVAMTATGGGAALVAFGGVLSGNITGIQLTSSAVYVYSIALNTWTLMPNDTDDSGPVPRYDHTAVVYNNVMYVFGGRCNNGLVNELWAWSIGNNSWVQIDSSAWGSGAPPPMAGHTAHLTGSYMVVFAGKTLPSGSTTGETFTNAMWNYSFASNTWQPVIYQTVAAPLPRFLHSSALYYNTSRIVPRTIDLTCVSPYPCFLIYGGENTDNHVFFSDMWLFSTATLSWTPILYMTTPQPLVDIGGATARSAAAVLITFRSAHQCLFVLSRMLCLGGYMYSGGYYDFVEFDPYFNRWFLPSYSNSVPFGLKWHRMVLSGGVLYVHGGVLASTLDYPSIPFFTTTYRRPQCYAGWEQPDGNYMCWSCPWGYASYAASYYCEGCPAGTYSPGPTGQGICTPCPAGTASTTALAYNISFCQICPAGTYRTSPGGTTCAPCPGGTYQGSNTSTSCTDCPSGTFRPDLPVYPLATDVSFCQQCQAGDYSSGGSTECLPCAPGYYSASPGQPFCQPCPLGTYSGGGLDSCTPCPPGTFSTSFATAARDSSACLSCPAGTANPNYGQGSCQPCSTGYYQNLQGQTSCQPCSPGTFGNVTGMTTAQCYSCPAGTYGLGSGQMQCQ
eukprot:RCo009795